MRTILGLLLLVTGCLGTPVPVPTPIEARAVRLGQPTAGGVVVAGLVGAAAGSDAVRITNLRTRQQAWGPVAANGSFALAIPATAGDELELRAIAGAATGSALAVMTPQPSGRPAPPAQVGAPDAAGLAAIDVSVSTGERALAAVPRTGEVIEAGSPLSVRVAKGDPIYVFSVDDQGRSSAHRVLVVLAVGPACADADGDGYGVVGSDLSACAASTVVPDCLDGQRDVHPGQPQFFAAPLPGAPAGLAFDFDCSGLEAAQAPSLIDCPGTKCGGAGWLGAVPDCGQPGTWARCVVSQAGCNAQAQETRTQACH